MKITRRQLRRLIKEEVQGILEAGKGGSADVAYPGQLGVGTPAGEGGQSASTKQDIEDEIVSTTAQINATTGEDSAAQAKKKVLQDQLKMLQQKISNLANVSG